MGTAPGARLCPAGAGCVHGRLRTAAPASRRPRGWAGCHRASRGHTGRGPCASRASPRPARGVLREPRCGGRAAGSNHGTAPASDQTPDRSAERTAAPVRQAHLRCRGVSRSRGICLYTRRCPTGACCVPSTRRMPAPFLDQPLSQQSLCQAWLHWPEHPQLAGPLRAPGASRHAGRVFRPQN